MITTGIIAEYNPFHNGHEYLLSKARSQTDADFLAVVMSGAFVQRGEPAIISKKARVEQALAGGADLVLELPFDCAMASAQTFARGGVGVLDACSVVDNLYFGSECGDVKILLETAQALTAPEFDVMLKKELESGKSYPAARQEVLRELIGERAQALAQPNNLLGIEYLLALDYFKSRIFPHTVARKGVSHDAENVEGTSVSAFALRNLIKDCKTVENYSPEACVEILHREIREGRGPVSVKDMERAMLAELRKMTPEDFKTIRDVSEGLEYSLYRASLENTDTESIITSVKSKRYTYSRIRRILMHAYLGLNVPRASESIPGYIRILGMKKSAAPLVKELRKKAKLPVLQRLASEKVLPDALRREIKATDIWGCFTPNPIASGEDFRAFPVIED